jgi:membrane protease YdiL (CAAX protease family)
MNSIMQLLVLLPLIFAGQSFIAIKSHGADHISITDISDIVGIGLIAISVCIGTAHVAIRRMLGEGFTDLEIQPKSVALSIAITILALLLSLTAVSAMVGPRFLFQFNASELANRILPAAGLAFFAATSEEIIFRAVLLKNLAARVGFVPAVGISSSIFGLIHLQNPGANIASVIFIALGPGIFLALVYSLQGGLASAIAAHFTWNYSLLILGLTMSGISAQSADPLENSPYANWMTGSAFGIEGSAPAAAAFVFASAIIFSRRKGRQISRPQ